MELEIMTKLKSVINLYTGKYIDLDKYIDTIEYNEDENKVIFILNYLGDDENKNRMMEREIIKICKIDLGLKGVKVSYNVQDEEVVQINPSTKIIAVMSGKGGVGKSNVAVGLARSLKKLGSNVGLIDADIYGYSIPALTNTIAEPSVTGKKIKPVLSEEGIEVISAHHFLPNVENKAIIWRGVKLNSLLNHFVTDVMWSKNLDYIVIDMPPGTGDVLLNINNLFEEVHALYVTTPNEDAAYVAERVIQVANELGFKELGLVENMAFYEVDNKKHYIFGSGGAELLANKYNLEILAKIPISDDLENEYMEMASKVVKNFDNKE